MFSDFPTWWNGLGMLEKIYWGVGIPFTLLFLIQLVLTLIGGDVSDDVDADGDGDSGIGFQFFTFKNLVAFFTIFSWTGIASIDSGVGFGLTVFLSVIAGLLMMTIMAAILYFLGQATESGTLIIENAVGAVGEVYMTVQGNRANIGKVQVQVQGTLRTLDALTDDDNDLEQGDVIDVVSIANDNILIVSKSLVG